MRMARPSPRMRPLSTLAVAGSWQEFNATVRPMPVKPTPSRRSFKLTPWRTPACGSTPALRIRAGASSMVSNLNTLRGLSTDTPCSLPGFLRDSLRRTKPGRKTGLVTARVGPAIESTVQKWIKSFAPTEGRWRGSEAYSTSALQPLTALLTALLYYRTVCFFVP